MSREEGLTDTRGEMILVVDDEQDIRALLRILLEKEGMRVIEASNGREAVDAVAADPHAVSLVILDIMMPVMDGVTAAAALREITDAPILFLTARSSDSDKEAAYGSGGDDYIVKPFHATDLILKLRAMLSRYMKYRRSAGGDTRGRSESSRVCHLGGDITVDPEEKSVYRGDRRVILTEREFELLWFFCQRRGETLTPADLYEAVWGEPYLSTASNTVIVHIANLRKKLEQSGGGGIIRTVWGKGYRLD